MSQENVEIVQAALEMWNTGDWDAFRDQNDPNVVVRVFEDWPEPGPYVGRDAVVQFFKQVRDVWDADAATPIDIVDAGDRVVVRQVWRGVGHGPDMNMEFTVVCTLRRGRIILAEYFRDHAEALEAVGLSEQDAHADS